MLLVDFILLFITVTYSVLGLINGFAKQLISIIGWILMLFIVFNHLDYMITQTSSLINLEEYNRIFTISILILLTLFLVFITNILFSKLIAATFFGSANRLLGMLFSFLKSQIYIFIFVLIAVDTPFKSDIVSNSNFIGYYIDLLKYVSDYDDSLFNTFQI